MSEVPCDRFELAIEMRLHGELGPEAGADLDAHLASCPSCREFESRARTIDRTLRDAAIEEEKDVDWSALRARVRGWRSQSLLAVIAVGALVLAGSLKHWLDRIARPSSGAPGITAFPVEVLFNAAVIGFIVWHVWTQWRDVRKATSPRYLTHFYRQDLARRIRSGRILIWGAPTLCLSILLGFVENASGFEGIVAKIFSAAVIGGLVWERFVVVPRLEREEQDLPFFDDFPHLF